MSKELGRTAKKYASRYLQLKVGHGAVGTYLAKIGGYWNPPMLVVRPSRTVCWAPIYQVPDDGEKRDENSSEICAKKELASKAGLREKG